MKFKVYDADQLRKVIKVAGVFIDTNDEVLWFLAQGNVSVADPVVSGNATFQVKDSSLIITYKWFDNVVEITCTKSAHFVIAEVVDSWNHVQGSWERLAAANGVPIVLRS